jgi:hypothetical protein
MQIKIDLPPLLKWQEEVYHSPERFKVVCIGRQAGKTHYGVIEAFINGCSGKDVLWVSPTHRQSEIGYRLIQRLTRQLPVEAKININAAQKRITFQSTGGVIEFRTGDEPDKLRGDTLDLAVFDEAAFMKPDVWTILRPSLDIRKGKGIFISTPCGKNWFYHLFLYAKNQKNKDWRSWQLPSAVNPYLSEQAIEEAKQDSLIDFEAEYLAHFTDSNYSVFRNFQHCIDASVQEWEGRPDCQYVIGCDWARHHDYTVFTVVNKTENNICSITRLFNVEYEEQRKSLEELADRFKPVKIICETNSIGDVQFEELKKESKYNIEAFWTDVHKKRNILDYLNQSFIKNRIRILNNPIFIQELEEFQAIRNPNTGSIRYSSPDGMHDDCVMSAAIALYGTKNKYPVIQTFDRSLIGL